MMADRKLLFAIVITTAASLSACSLKSEREVVSDDPLAHRATQAAQQEDQFGKGFGKAFRADPNSEPAKVNANDVAPVSLTEEPLPVH